MPKFTTKPIEIEARQVTGTSENQLDIIDWMPGASLRVRIQNGGASIQICMDSRGFAWAKTGDWIVKFPPELFQVYGADTFEKNFIQMPPRPSNPLAPVSQRFGQLP